MGRKSKRGNNSTPIGTPLRQKKHKMQPEFDGSGSESEFSGEEARVRPLSNKDVIDMLDKRFNNLVTHIDEKLEPFNNVLKEIKGMKGDIACLSNNIISSQLRGKYDSDALEQYTRRDNIRITGIPEEAGEDVISKVLEIANDIKAKVKIDDISIAHRVGKQTVKPRPIICRFTRRTARDEMIKNRKVLKSLEKYGNNPVYINDDLTTLRSKLFGYVKSLPNVARANVNNGKIFCNILDGTLIIVESPDDLFKLGINDIDYNRLGLTSYSQPPKMKTTK